MGGLKLARGPLLAVKFSRGDGFGGGPNSLLQPHHETSLFFFLVAHKENGEKRSGYARLSRDYDLVWARECRDEQTRGEASRSQRR